MKKTIIFCLVALSSAVVSCRMEEQKALPSGMECGETPSRHVATDFMASLPGAGTKTAVDMETGTVTWLKDDPILISNGSESMTLYVEEGGSTRAALYAAEEVIEGNSFYAVYPASAASYSEGVFMAMIPSRQIYAEGGFAPETFPMIASCDSRRNFSFRNAAALLEITVSSEEFKDMEISSLTLSSDDALSGLVSAIVTESSDILIDSSQGEKTVTVDATQNPVPMGIPIYVVVPPGDFSDLKADITFSNGIGYTCKLAETVSVNRSAYRKVSLAALDDYVDLSADETANCYMLTAPGRYKFRADVKGNGVVTSSGIAPQTSDISESNIYYRDGENFLVGGFGYHDGYLYFQTVDGQLPTGTALVSVLDAAGKTLWSWHVWANSLIADVQLSDGSVWLNMNLGAHQPGFNKEGYNGYYYQWGRKDPFLQKYTDNTSVSTLSPFVSHASKTDGSVANSIANPNIFYGGYHPSGVTETTEDWSSYNDDVVIYDLWNKDITADQQTGVAASKTMFDPCPAGYHVPVYSDLAGLLELALAGGSGSEANGWTIDGKLFFPYTSYRYISLNSSWWPGGSTVSRAFIPSATPYENTTKSHRRFYRMYLSSDAAHKVTNGARAYGVPVRCIKDASYVQVSSVTLDKTALELTEGDECPLIATVLPGNATEKSLVWTSSDNSVATVTDGTVTAIKEGTAVITAASSSGPSASCTVTVKPKTVPVTSVTLSRTSLELVQGGSFLLTADILPEDATDKTLIWSSSNAAVTTVSGGHVAAVSEGTAVITATASSGQSASCTVTVKKSGGGLNGGIEDMIPDDWN